MSGGSGIAFPSANITGGYQPIWHDENLFSLEEFRRELSYHPYHFWGLAGTKAPVTSSCNDTVNEYAWQAPDIVGRREIAKAIQSAEEKLRTHLGFSIAPHYTEEVHDFPRYINPQFDRLGYAGSDGRWTPITTDEAELINGGIEKLVTIGDAVLVFSDSDSDGLNDVFTATIPTTVTDADEIIAFFKTSDIPEGEDISGNRSWEIAPISVSISNGTATIKGRIWQVVKPVLYQGIGKGPLDAADYSNTYVSEISIKQRTTYSGTTVTDSQVAFIWETTPYPLFPENSSPIITNSLDPASIAYATGRMAIRNSENGLIGVGLATYDALTSQWCHNYYDAARPPDRVVIRYLAGVPRVKGLVNPTYRECVFRMACAELTRPICACDKANKQLHEWQFDLARTSGSGDESYGAVSREDLTNPFGTRRGHISAWKMVRDLGRQTGVAL